jgi:polygalacturonase
MTSRVWLAVLIAVCSCRGSNGGGVVTPGASDTAIPSPPTSDSAVVAPVDSGTVSADASQPASPDVAAPSSDGAPVVAPDAAADHRPIPDAAGCTGEGPLPWPQANMIVCDVRNHAPTIPNHTCTVTDPAYGAKADGTTDDTAAFARAIAGCESQGGGHVEVPAGTYSTGAITLDSNIDLHFAAGAVIKFNANMANYPMVQTRYEGTGLMNNSPMVYAFGKHDVSITGPGILDATNSPSFARRTNFVEPYSCTNVLIQGITLKGSHFWQFHPTMSTYVWVEGVTTTDSGMSNNDGFDPESCTSCVLTDSTIQAGDDAIAIKSGRDDYGRMINVPTSNFVFMHVKFSSRWGLMTLGSELSGGIHDVYAYDVETTGPGVAYVFEIKGNCLRGATVKDVHMDTVRSAGGAHKGIMWADMNYMNQNPAGTCPHVPMYSDFSIGHATISGGPRVLDVANDARFPIKNVAFTDSTFTMIGDPSNSAPGSNVTWTNVTINGQPAR